MHKRHIRQIESNHFLNELRRRFFHLLVEFLLQPKIDKRLDLYATLVSLLLKRSKQLYFYRYSTAYLKLDIRRIGVVEICEVVGIPEFANFFIAIRLGNAAEIIYAHKLRPI